MPKTGYPIHPIALTMPEMSASEYSEFKKDVRENGQRIAAVLLPDDADDGKLKVLDGRHRQSAAIETGHTPTFRMYDHETDGQDPIAFVVSHNLRRRNLSPSQAAMAAAKLLQIIKAREEAAKSATLVPPPTPTETTEPPVEPTGGSAAGVTEKHDTPTSGDEPATSAESIVDTSGDYGQVQPKKAKDAKPKSKSTGGKSAAKVAAQLGVSTRSVETASTLLKNDPAAAEQVAQGGTSLNAAVTGKPSKGSEAAKVYDTALARIEKVCGAKQATGIKEGAILRNRKDVIAYAALDDDKMLAIRALIDQGWTLKKATHAKAEMILDTHNVRALIERTVLAGGEYEQKVHVENLGIVANIKVVVTKGEATQARKAKEPKKKPAKKSATKKKK